MQAPFVGEVVIVTGENEVNFLSFDLILGGSLTIKKYTGTIWLQSNTQYMHIFFIYFYPILVQIKTNLPSLQLCSWNCIALNVKQPTLKVEHSVLHIKLLSAGKTVNKLALSCAKVNQSILKYDFPG